MGETKRTSTFSACVDSSVVVIPYNSLRYPHSLRHRIYVRFWMLHCFLGLFHLLKHISQVHSMGLVHLPTKIGQFKG